MAWQISRSRLFSFWFLICIFFLTVFFLHGGSESAKASLGPMLGGSLLKGSSKAKPNAVIVMLVSPSRINQALVALRNVEDRFNRRLQYPYVILTEATITEEIQQKADWITDKRAKFADLPAEMWGPPPFLSQEGIDASLKNIGFSMGYRSMCRFFSGYFWKHPAIAPYEWIWRLDSDIEFHCDVPYDPIIRVRDAGALYGFVQVNGDSDYVQPTLAGNISEFLSKNSHLVPPGANQGFVWHNLPKVMQGNGGNAEWTRWTFYNNWEISHRSVWESEIYTGLFDHLEHAGGFYYERWSDAPIHSFGVAMSLRTDQVMQFTDMGYEHQAWPYECPFTSDKCTCVLNDNTQNFDNRGYEWFNASTRRPS
ncbi:glycosyltransferase family 15 protein [Sphaerobolus stellatus SS14]|nr:glycosyltransferase family 15 protein [Sphaerobolus stellatus SS14]